MSYTECFLGEHTVKLPALNKGNLSAFSEHNLETTDFYLDYINYSLLLNPSRGFPFYTASNIDGNLFCKIKRDELFKGGDRWVKDDRVSPEYQYGKELYTAFKSDFDRGHLTKREDVQWGSDSETARKAAQSTFYYTNAIPQVGRLNRGVWRQIEDYILHHETVKKDLKISLFSGPVFMQDDPHFVTKVNDHKVKLPYLFWKIIFYQKEGVLHRTAFIASQRNLLQKKGIVEEIFRGEETGEELFNTFKDAETYQTKVSLIEALSGLEFSPAQEVFDKDIPLKLLVENVNVRSEEAILERGSINNLTL